MKETVGKLLNDVSYNFVLKAKRNRSMNKSVSESTLGLLG